MTDVTPLQPTATPVRAFLDWPVVTDPSEWTAEVALVGIQRRGVPRHFGDHQVRPVHRVEGAT
jgi:hypothetical protein